MPTDPTINTRQADRRDVQYASLDDLRADLDAIERAHAAGTLRNTGNWSPGQVLEHLAIFMECALDGFPHGKIPWHLRTVAKLLFKNGAVSGKPPPPGFNIPDGAAFLRPGEDTSFEAGMTRLRTCLDRLAKGDTLDHPSPLFGKLTHEEWTQLQLGHASLHLSFLHPDAA